ncbi:MAG: glycosyltransferase [Paludibacter sp.]|nr:glycosyltransferase [Paludibacter sp.]
MVEFNNKYSLSKECIMFYSSVRSKKMFSVQQFHRTDICILRDLGYKVVLSNSVFNYLKFWKYDIAFIYFYRYGLFPAIFAKLFRKKVLFTGGIDNLDKEYAGIKKHLIQKIFFQLCTMFSDRNIIVSNSDLKNIKLFKPKLPSDIFPLSFHVIDFDNYASNDILKKEKILTTIAWMLGEDNVIRKGVDKSLYLFKKLHEIDNEFRMVIIGPQGKGTQLVRNIIKKENLEELVTLTGAIPELEKINILKRSSVYSQLSNYEGFGIAAIEALASGNIVVHSGKGGLKDGIGNCGIIVENDDYDKIIQYINIIINDYQARSEIIRQGIQFVSENFKYEKRLNDFRNIFKSLK